MARFRVFSDSLRRQAEGLLHTPYILALLFIHSGVLKLEIGGVDAIRAKRAQYVLTVLTEPKAIGVHRAVREHSLPSHSLALQRQFSPNRRTTLTSKDVDSAQQ